MYRLRRASGLLAVALVCGVGLISSPASSSAATVPSVSTTTTTPQTTTPQTTTPPTIEPATLIYNGQRRSASNVGPAVPYFKIVVPAGQANLRVTVDGDANDAALYVRRGALPTAARWDCLDTFTLTCSFDLPIAGTYYVALPGTYSDLGITATFSALTPPTTTIPPLPALPANGVYVNDLAGTTGSRRVWTITVPAGRSKLSVNIRGGSGNADLYVQRTSVASPTSYLCASARLRRGGECVITQPPAGVYTVLLYGASAYTNVDIRGVIK